MRRIALFFCLFLMAGTLQARAATCALPEGSGATLDAVLSAINKARRAQGRADLVRDAAIDAAAQGHACYMAGRDKLGHDGNGGPKRRMRKAGCKARTTGEAIAAGQRNAAEVVESWMQSPPHKTILLLSSGRKVGLGVARSARDNRLYWVFDVANTC